MKNRDYWQARFIALENSRYQSSKDMQETLEAAWERTYRETNAEIEKWIYRIADNNGLSYQEARKLLDADQLEEFRWDVNTYIKKGKENALNGNWVKQLENASARVHISRLEAMQIQIRQEVEMLYAQYDRSIGSYLRDTYRDDYYRSAFEIAKGTGIGINLHKISRADAEQVLKRPWAFDGKVFSSRIWGDRDKLVRTLNEELIQQIARGTAPQKAIKAVSEKLRTTRSQAGRLVMTEAAAISAAAKRDVFQDLGVEYYEIVATLDWKTSDICRDMDGKVFKMSEYKPGLTAPPFHPWCRSTMVPWFEDNFDTVWERAARSEDGKTYYVPADMTYSQWEKSFVAGDKEGLQETTADDKMKAKAAGTQGKRQQQLPKEEKRTGIMP